MLTFRCYVCTQFCQQMFVEHLCLPHSAKQQGVKEEEDKAPDRGKTLPGTHCVRDA